MKSLLFLSITGITKRKLTSILIIFLISISISLINTAVGLFNSFESRIISQILVFTPHISIDSINSRNFLKFEKNITRIVEINKLQGLLINQDSNLSKGALIQAIGRNAMASYIEPSKITGKLPEKNEILLGKKLIKALNSGIGEKVYLVLSPEKLVELKVSGIIDSGIAEYDNTLGIVCVSSIKRLANFQNKIIGIWINKPQEARLFANKLYKYGFKDISNWQDENQSLVRAINTEKLVVFFISSLLIILTAVSICAFQTVNIISHKKQYGILAASGLTPFNMLSLLFTESGILAVVGIFIGNAVTLTLKHIFSSIPNSFNPGSLELNFSDLLINSLVILVFCLISSLIPAICFFKTSTVNLLKD